MTNKLKTAGKIGIGLAASVGMGWMASRGLNWSEVQNSFHDTSYGLVLLAVLVFMAACYFRASRWKMLFLDNDISTRRLFVIQNEGIGLNNVVPIRIASEATQVAVLTRRERMGGAKALATLAIERVVDLIASTMILGVAFLMVPEIKSISLYLWGAAGVALTALILVKFMAWGSGNLAFINKFTFLADFASAIKDLERENARLAASFFLSIAYWLLIGTTAWIIAVAVNLPLSPLTAMLVIIATILFATAVPAAPGAIGTFEWAVVSMMALFGVGKEESFAFAIIGHAVFFLPPTIIAAIFLPREGVVSFNYFRTFTGRPAEAS